MLFAEVRSPGGAEYAVNGHPASRPTNQPVYRIWARILDWLIGDVILRGRWAVSVWTSPDDGLPHRKWNERVDYRGTAEDRVEALVRLIESGQWTPGTGAPPSSP